MRRVRSRLTIRSVDPKTIRVRYAAQPKSE